MLDQKNGTWVFLYARFLLNSYFVPQFAEGEHSLTLARLLNLVVKQTNEVLANYHENKAQDLKMFANLLRALGFAQLHGHPVDPVLQQQFRAVDKELYDQLQNLIFQTFDQANKTRQVKKSHIFNALYAFKESQFWLLHLTKADT